MSLKHSAGVSDDRRSDNTRWVSELSSVQGMFDGKQAQL